MKRTKFTRYHKQVRDILQSTPVRQPTPGDLAVRLENYCKTLRHNQFVTVLNVYDYAFTFQHGVEQVLGYAKEEFTAKNLIGQGRLKNGLPSIIHPEDVSWYLHYGTLLYKLLNALRYTVDFSTDYAWFRFRVYAASGQLHVAEYVTLLHEVNEAGQMLSHLDIWTVLPFNEHEVFSPGFGFYTADNYAPNAELFYNMNEEQLGVKFSEREIAIGRKMMLGLTRKEVADQLGIGVGSINTHMNNMKQKANAFLSKNSPDKSVSNITELLRFAAAYKLLR